MPSSSGTASVLGTGVTSPTQCPASRGVSTGIGDHAALKPAHFGEDFHHALERLAVAPDFDDPARRALQRQHQVT